LTWVSILSQPLSLVVFAACILATAAYGEFDTSKPGGLISVAVLVLTGTLSALSPLWSWIAAEMLTRYSAFNRWKWGLLGIATIPHVIIFISLVVIAQKK
jgi:hypothetical protein